MWTMRDVRALPPKFRKTIEEQLDGKSSGNKIAWCADTKSKRGKQKTLDLENEPAPRMVNITGPVLVRITRVGKRILDGDNHVGGSKELRDAIASSLGRKGDSEAENMFWEYKQKKGEPETIVEIFTIEVDEEIPF